MTLFTRSLSMAMAVLTLGVSMAHAQPYDQRQRDDQRSHRSDHRADHRPDRRPDHRRDDHRPDHRRDDHRSDHRRDDRPDYRRDDRRDDRSDYRSDHRRGYGPAEPPPRIRSHRGAGPNHDWHRGSRVPPMYRTQHYVVNDWRLHRLTPPPRGYYWVQNGADYLLIAIATGVIAQIILSQ